MNKKLLTVLCLVMGLSMIVCAGCQTPTNSTSQDSSSQTKVCEHVYDNACDTDCNECGEIRADITHTYDNACDASCNECGEIRADITHTYDNACDATCNECGAERTASEHVYSNACDATCNECGAERTASEHVYSNSCDATCNECGAERSVGEHVYSNACDATCNECGLEREVPAHVYSNACDATCNECGAEREGSAHVYEDDNDTNCNECGAEREIITLASQDVDLDLTFDEDLVLSTDNAILSLSEVSALEIVTLITYNGEEIEGAKYENGEISLPKSLFGTAFGEASVVVYAKNGEGRDMIINAPILLITKAISNATELDMMYTLADALDVNAKGKSYAFISDGYFVLDQNVSYNKAFTAWPAWNADGGKWRDASIHGFKGVIDGRGYTIEGLEINTNFNAFVTLLHTEGSIKNLGFTNAKLTGAASSLVCLWGGGTIENVYVQYAAGVLGAGGGYNGTFFAADNARGITPGNGLKIYDCFVDASKITAEGTPNKSCFIGYAYGKQENIDLTANYVTMHGVFALGSEGVNNKYAIYIPDTSKDFYWPSATAAGIKDHGKSQRELATWNTEYWTIVEGIPTWNSAVAK